ncbi:MAG: hypothetical protein ACYDDU_09580 [Dermatophilaceae bacterium]
MQALACDVRFAAVGAKFTTSYARRGLAGEDGVSWLQRLIGRGRALDLLLSARVVQAEEVALAGRYVASRTRLYLSIDVQSYLDVRVTLCRPRWSVEARAVATPKRLEDERTGLRRRHQESP